nr:serine protease filzig-like isoform X1 [Cherax quadricarinatus]XP_053653091.1 serine protease filzig-like isoform X1 [Cherax quadricarinatus]
MLPWAECWRRQATALVVFVLVSLTTAHPFLYLRGSRYGYGRNIRPLPCTDKKINEAGVCMFAWDCKEANGTHLGTCIDRFYFGSCCKLQSAEAPPSEITNEIPSSGSPMIPGFVPATKPETIKPGPAGSAPGLVSGQVSTVVATTSGQTEATPGTTGSPLEQAGTTLGQTGTTAETGTTVETNGTTVGTTGSTLSQTGTTGSSITTAGTTGATAGTTGPSITTAGTTGIVVELPGTTGITAGSTGTTVGTTGTTAGTTGITAGTTGNTVGISITTAGTTGITVGQTETTVGPTGTNDGISITSAGNTGITVGTVVNQPETTAGTPVGTTTTESTAGATETTLGPTDTTEGHTAATDHTGTTIDGPTGQAGITEEQTGTNNTYTEEVHPSIEATERPGSTEESVISMEPTRVQLPTGVVVGGTEGGLSDQEQTTETTSSSSTIDEGETQTLRPADEEQTSSDEPSTATEASVAVDPEPTHTEVTHPGVTVQGDTETPNDAGSTTGSSATPLDGEVTLPHSQPTLPNLQSATPISAPATESTGLQESTMLPTTVFSEGDDVTEVETTSGSINVEDKTTPVPEVVTTKLPVTGFPEPATTLVGTSQEVETTIDPNFSPASASPEPDDATEIISGTTLPSSTKPTDEPESAITTLPQEGLDQSISPASVTPRPGTVSSPESTTLLPSGHFPVIFPGWETTEEPFPTDTSDRTTDQPEAAHSTPSVSEETDKASNKPDIVETTLSPGGVATDKPESVTEKPVSVNVTFKPSVVVMEKPVGGGVISIGPGIVEVTEKPVTEESTVKPTIVELTEKPVTEESTVKPTIVELTEKPVTEESTVKPTIVELTEKPVTEESTVKPTIVELTEKPVTEESTVKPTIVELTEKPVSVDVAVNPAIEITEKPVSGNVTVKPDILNATTTEGFVDEFLVKLNTSNYKDICGVPVYPTGRIVGGNEATFGEWPWQVSLRQWRQVTFLHKCGAALLNENWAITAAHCVENVQPEQLLLRLGEFDLERSDEPYPFAERKVQIIATHPKFDARTFEFDLALLRFYEPVSFLPNIIPICVPQDDYSFLNNTGYVTGWGRLYEDGPLPSVLQKVPVPVITNKECEDMYRAAGYVEHIPNIFICAGYERGKRDSCEGDSGGPLVIQRNGVWNLAGVISWGIGCALPNQPGVYTRISEFREWIEKIIVF